MIYRAPLSDFRFVLDDYLQVDQYADLPGFADLTSDVRSAILEGAAKICESTLLPLNAPGDREGCRLENGRVFTPTGFPEAYRAFVEGGWTSLPFDPEYGGQGLPFVISIPIKEMLVSSNMAFSGYIDLTEAAASCLSAHGSPDQKRRYLPKLVSGQWAGAMHLTEPHAGTDLGLIRTHAEPRGDGTYRLHGSKIFITGADQDLTENVVNLVLARLPDAPAGTRGLSLFIAPRRLVDSDAGLREPNTIHVVNLEQKLGVHASATGTVVYEGAVAELVEPANRGLSMMFTMMNHTRLGVGVQGLGISEIAWQNAVAYAREREQGRRPGGAVDAARPADPIAAHPDVRRMLLTMKAFNEAARALALWCGVQLDLAARHPEVDARERADALIGLLTPVIKAHYSDAGFTNANLALQCFGGHGYIVETGIEQLVRDIRIAGIYEGTNGVQALDLALRKLTQSGGRAVDCFLELVQERIAEADAAGLHDYGAALRVALDALLSSITWVRDRLRGDVLDVAAGASDFLHLFALTALGWTWAGLALAALRRLSRGADPDYCRDKIATGRFYMAGLPSQAVMLAQRTKLGNSPLDGVSL